MVVLIGAAVLAVLCALIGYSAVRMHDYSVSASEKLSASEVSRYAEAIQAKVDNAFALSRGMAFQLQAHDKLPLEGRRDIIDQQMVALYQNNKDELVDFWTVWEPNAFDGRDAMFAGIASNTDASGRYVTAVSQSGIEPTGAYDDPANNWYHGPIKTGEEFASEPYDYTYAADNRTVKLITLSVPIIKDGKVVGVFGTDLEIQKLITLVQGMYTDGPRAVLLTAEGTYLVPLNKEEQGKNIKDVSPAYAQLFSEAVHGKLVHSVVEPDGGGEKEYLVYAPIQIGRTKTPWVLGVHIPASIVLAEANTSTLIALVSGAAAFLLIIALVFLIAKSIVDPLQRVSAAATEVAKGNLDVTIAGTGRKDEIENLVLSLRTMIVNLKEMVTRAKEKSAEAEAESLRAHEATDKAMQVQKEIEQSREVILSVAEQVGVVVASVGQAVNALSSSIKIAENNVHRQSERIQETTAAMQQMYATVEEVARNADNSAISTEQTRKTAEEGSLVVQNSVSSINTVQSAVGVLKEKMSSLGQLAGAINEIINVISDIADQTNLLALNAAIEAARAGEAGRGFAVVADEVRKLAEKTMHATSEVSSTINNITRGIHDSLESADKVVADIGKTTEHAGESGQALNVIVKEVEDIAGQVRAIAVASQEQLQTCEAINRSVHEISGMAVETSEAMTSSTASVNGLLEQNHSLQKLMQELLKAN